MCALMVSIVSRRCRRCRPSGDHRKRRRSLGGMRRLGRRSFLCGAGTRLRVPTGARRHPRRRSAPHTKPHTACGTHQRRRARLRPRAVNSTTHSRSFLESRERTSHQWNDLEKESTTNNSILRDVEYIHTFYLPSRRGLRELRAGPAQPRRPGACVGVIVLSCAVARDTWCTCGLVFSRRPCSVFLLEQGCRISRKKGLVGQR